MVKRARANPALEEAIRIGRELDLPVVVYEGLNHDYPEANARIHRFILECARDTASALHERGLRYVFDLRRGEADKPRKSAALMMREAAVAVVDDFPSFILPAMRRRALQLTEDAQTPVLAIDANGVVPLAEIPGQEFAARTIRPKLHRLMASYLHPVEERAPHRDSRRLRTPVSGIEAKLRGASDETLKRLVDACDIDHEVRPSRRYRGGRAAGLARLERFVRHGLPRYASEARIPGAGVESGLSPYLHFGCLAPQEIALRVLYDEAAGDENIDAFLEQLIVRRELSYNFCWYNPRHDRLTETPPWAKETMAAHRYDPREQVYRRADLEAARTDDPVWNAAQRELVATGTFHNYMRMLWGKNIIRWTLSYDYARRLMIAFHHRYALDGRNPNTYANILWCFGLHDRPFAERPVLGKLRPLTSRSTERKFDLGPYFEQVEAWDGDREMPLDAENLRSPLDGGG